GGSAFGAPRLSEERADTVGLDEDIEGLVDDYRRGITGSDIAMYIAQRQARFLSLGAGAQGIKDAVSQCVAGGIAEYPGSGSFNVLVEGQGGFEVPGFDQG